MSDRRPASFFSVVAVFLGLGLFAIVLRYAYTAPVARPVYNVVSDNLPEDQAWRATPQGRQEHLRKLQAEQRQLAAEAGWVDKGKGVVRLPIDQAMKLTVEERKSGVRR